jgi:hypothetical protein
MTMLCALSLNTKIKRSGFFRKIREKSTTLKIFASHVPRENNVFSGHLNIVRFGVFGAVKMKWKFVELFLSHTREKRLVGVDTLIALTAVPDLQSFLQNQ